MEENCMNISFQVSYSHFLPFTTLSISIKESVCQLSWGKSIFNRFKFEIQLFTVQFLLCAQNYAGFMNHTRNPHKTLKARQLKWSHEKELLKELQSSLMCQENGRKFSWCNCSLGDGENSFHSLISSGWYEMPITLYFIKLFGNRLKISQTFSPHPRFSPLPAFPSKPFFSLTPRSNHFLRFHSVHNINVSN